MQQITSVLVTGVWSFNYGGKYKTYVSELSYPRRKEAKLLVGECFLVLISQQFWPALYLGRAPVCSFWTMKWEVLRNMNRALRMCSHTFQNKSWLLFLNNLRIWIAVTFPHCILPPPPLLILQHPPSTFHRRLTSNHLHLNSTSATSKYTATPVT